MQKVWEFAPLIDSFTGTWNRLCEGSGTTAKYADFRDIWVLLLDKFEEGGHIWSAKVIDRL